MSLQVRGHITREATVWCGRCDAHRQVTPNEHKPRGLGPIFKSLGWTRYRHLNWICPMCTRAIAITEGVKP